MLKTVALSASALAFAGGLAFAQTAITRELSTKPLLASDIYKANVCDPSEQKIGAISDLMIDSNGNVTAAIISVGGFLGVNQKDVVIPFKEMRVSTRGGKNWLVVKRTKDELTAAPAYNNTGSPSEYRGKGGDIIYR
ncbi:MAG: PRC-barrel domain-containing protein [Methylocella sp.]